MKEGLPAAETASSTRKTVLLETIIGAMESVLVGFSAGVDSTFLAVIARRVLGRGRCVAATGISPSLTGSQLQVAERLAKTFDLDWVQVRTDEVDDPRYIANDTSRCFFCKRELWTRLGALALERDIAVVLDGTNADDLGGHRPGKAAGERAGVRSPLAEAGFTKPEIRAEAQRLGIPNWNAPANPCLSSRVKYGVSVTPARLRQVELGEELLRAAGITGNLRLRHRGSEARIEIETQQFETLRRSAGPVVRGLCDAGFERITLDLQGYRSGSLLSDEEAQVEVLSERQ